MENSERILRTVEREIVDNHHKSFEAFNYSDSAVIPFLLKAYGDMERHTDSILTSGYSEFTIKRFHYHFVQGVTQCIKWIYGNQGKPIGQIPAAVAWNETIMQFISWGMDYYILSQQFVAYSRGIFTCQVLEDEKKIVFIPPEESDFYFLTYQFLLHDDFVENSYNKLPHELIDETFSKWFKQNERKFSKPPIADSLNWEAARKSTLFEKLNQHFNEVILPEIDPDFDLGGYSVRDFRIFHSILFLQFSFIRWIEGLYDVKLPREYNVFGSNPIVGDPPDVFKFFSSATTLGELKCHSIINDLTLDVNNIHSSLYLQPFFKTRTEIGVLPNLYALVEPNRMLIGALTKSVKKFKYDKLINQIENYHVQRLFDYLSSLSTWKVYLQPKLANGKKIIRPDIVIVDTRENSVLVIDYKHLLTPISTSEVDYRLSEIEKGLDQVKRYCEAISMGFTGAIKESLQKYIIHGMLVFHRPIPIPIHNKHGCVTVTDSMTLMQLANVTSINTCIKAVNGNSSERLKGLSLIRKEMITRVNGWTFSRTAVVSRDEKSH